MVFKRKMVENDGSNPSKLVEKALAMKLEIVQPRLPYRPWLPGVKTAKISARIFECNAMVSVRRISSVEAGTCLAVEEKRGKESGRGGIGQIISDSRGESPFDDAELPQSSEGTGWLRTNSL